MAPMISASKRKENNHHKHGKFLKDEKKKLIKKVRDIYYDKNSTKTIYGTTTAKERRELVEEGIDLLSIPWIEKDN